MHLALAASHAAVACPEPQCCIASFRSARLLYRERNLVTIPFPGKGGERSRRRRYGTPNDEPPEIHPYPTRQSLRPMRGNHLPSRVVGVSGPPSRSAPVVMRGVRIQVRDAGLVPRAVMPSAQLGRECQKSHRHAMALRFFGSHWRDLQTLSRRECARSRSAPKQARPFRPDAEWRAIAGRSRAGLRTSA